MMSRSRRSRKSSRKSKKHHPSSPQLYKLYPSILKTKKFDIYVYNNKTGRVKKVSFGAKGYSDYTIHKDKDRRERYRIRHKRDHIRDPLSSGFWSWWVLWVLRLNRYDYAPSGNSLQWKSCLISSFLSILDILKTNAWK